MALENKTALVVDDDADLIGVTKLALNSLGIQQVSLAANGLEAKAIVEAAKQPFDIVICDWIMPELDGPGFLSFFRKENRESPFIMLTGQSSEENFSEISSNPNDFFMTKQSSLNDIMEMISKVLGH
jgi:two-component system, chemotaxis family, chemotaxis protein CheY